MKPWITPVVDSTAIIGIGYDEEAQELYVMWSGRDTYVYSGVPPLVHRILMNERSKGGYINKMIKPHYPCREVYD